MDSSRKYLDIICEVCDCEYKQQERLYKIAKWKNRCPKHRKNEKVYKCIDCNKDIDKSATRCKTCSGKNRTIKKRLCVDCSAIISRKAKKRCIKCHNKNQDKGLSKERTKFSASKKWAKKRISCFERDNYTCTVCGVRGGVVLNAHHIVRYVDSKELRLELSNLVTVCVPCHKEIHFGKKI